MKLRMLLGAALLVTAPLFAGTYFGGLEDYNALDYDYNDAVFSIAGSDLTLHSATGHWYVEPSLGSSGIPFWNNKSIDGPNYNVGYCIYGGGSCGAGLDPGAQYLAASPTSKTGSANDVYFSASGSVELDSKLQITAASDVLGWYSTSDPSQIHFLNTSSQSGVFTFDPGGNFGLVGNDMGATMSGGQLEGSTYFSQDWYGTSDSVSHFAFFGNPAQTVTPEPGMIGLFSTGLAGVAFGICRRKKR